jgi:hypothetical protein
MPITVVYKVNSQSLLAINLLSSVQIPPPPHFSPKILKQQFNLKFKLFVRGISQKSHNRENLFLACHEIAVETVSSERM